MDNQEVLVEVSEVSKKFCKNLKKSLWYGMLDILREFRGASKTTHLRKDEFYAVDNLSFNIRRGECLGLIGHNGAGKSTLLKMLNGLIKPDNGYIKMTGRIGALIELGTGFNPILTGRENIYNNAAVLGFSKEEVDDKFDSILEFSEIGEFIDTPVQNYSSGMKVRLGFAVAAQMNPDILIIDEVLAVGDAGFRIKCFNKIHEIIENTAVILVSHSMPQISKVSSKILLLTKGRQKYYGSVINEGIEQYFKQFNNGKSFYTDNKGLKLRRCLISSSGQTWEWDTHRENVASFNYLSDLHFKLFFDSKLNFGEKGFGCVLRFFDMSLIPVATCQFNRINFVEEFEFIIPKVQFGQAQYQMDIYLLRYSKSTETILAHYKNILTFNIVNGLVENQALFQLDKIIIN